MNIDELEKLARAATPGPWEFDNHSPHMPLLGLYARDKKGLWHVSRLEEQAASNTAYIAAANPAAILELISINRELERALDNAVYLEPKLLRIANIANAHAALNKEQS